MVYIKNETKTEKMSIIKNSYSGIAKKISILYL